MKVLRVTRWGPDLAPVTMVMREQDAKVPLEEVGGEEFGFLVTDIFEIEGTHDIVMATAAAHGRGTSAANRERDMAILYYWTFAQFRLLTDGGHVISDQPAPLTREEILYVWRQLAKLDEYRDFTFATFDQYNDPVRFKAGREIT